MQNEPVFKAMTQEQREKMEQELAEQEARLGICVSCGS